MTFHTIIGLIEYHLWSDIHLAALHILIHLGLLCQIYLAEIVTGTVNCRIAGHLCEHVCSHHFLSITAQEHFVGIDTRADLELRRRRSA